MEEVSVQPTVPLKYIRRSCSEQRQPQELKQPVSHLHCGFRWETSSSGDSVMALATPWYQLLFIPQFRSLSPSSEPSTFSV